MNKASFILVASRLGLAALMLFVCAGVVISQEKVEKIEKLHKAEYKEKTKEFCSNNWSNGDKFSASDLRQMTLPISGSLDLNSGKNGGIKVKGENRENVALRACVQTWGETEEAARAMAANVKINANGSMVRAEGPTEGGWSVSFEVRVPFSTNLKLAAHNGGISIGMVEGNIEFETQNGGVSLSDVAGDVRGRTMNGGVNVSLSGNTWKGSGLDVSTTNGGVNLMIPVTYAANIETGTVNGGFKSDIPALNVTTEDTKGGYGHKPKQINTAINGGGAPIRLTTKNGGIRIGAAQNY